MTRTEHDCRWRLLEAYTAWIAGCTSARAREEVEAAVWQFYLAMQLRAPRTCPPPAHA